MFIVVFIITILILVVIHELGHFLVARKFNIKVLEFGFGIPPRAWGKKWGETLISLNWLPFGGFVRLLGEDESDPETLKNKRSFASQAVWKRILVVVAGVGMNLLLAFVLFYLVIAAQNFKVQLPLLTNYHFAGVKQTNEQVVLVVEVAKGSPAEQVHLKPEDRIIAINGQPIASADQLVAEVKAQAGKPVTLTLTDVQKTQTRVVSLVPRENPPPGQGSMGVALGTFEMANLEYATLGQKLLAGPIHSYNLVLYSGQILGQTIAASFAKKDFTPVSQNVAGPVGITTIIKQILAIKNPLIPLLDFVAALSLNLAVVNVLPFPGLDGGRLLFLVIEAITGKKAHPTLEKYVHGVGLVLIVGLLILSTLSDLKKLF